MARLPAGGGYVEAGAALTRLAGRQAWLEAGWRPHANVGLFARGYLREGDAGILGGVRVQW